MNRLLLSTKLKNLSPKKWMNPRADKSSPLASQDVRWNAEAQKRYAYLDDDNEMALRVMDPGMVKTPSPSHEPQGSDHGEMVMDVDVDAISKALFAQDGNTTGASTATGGENGSPSLNDYYSNAYSGGKNVPMDESQPPSPPRLYDGPDYDQEDVQIQNIEVSLDQGYKGGIIVDDDNTEFCNTTTNDNNNNNENSDNNKNNNKNFTSRKLPPFPIRKLPPFRGSNKQYRALLLASNLFFVLGSILYLVMAVDDLQWAKEAKSIPTAVLLADDDVTWSNYEVHDIVPGDIHITNNTNHNSTRRFLSVYDDYDWSDLPYEQQAAAQILGYDQESWDNALDVTSSSLEWDQLSHYQQTAATVLGYDSSTWEAVPVADADAGKKGPNAEPAADASEPDRKGPNADAEPEATEAPLPEIPATTPPEPEYPVLKYDNVPWMDLPKQVQKSAEDLGYNEELWDKDYPPRIVTESPSIQWQDLSKKEQRAAEVLGYSETTWWFIRRNYDNFQVQIDGSDNTSSNHSSNSTSTTTTSAPGNGTDSTTPAMQWEDYEWYDLPMNIRTAFAILGYTETIWDNDEAVESDTKAWSELTPEEQEAAVTVGYTQALWDNEDISPVADGYVSIEDGFAYDDEDDVRYMRVYVFAALCFIVVGSLDLFRERNLFHTTMIFAGFMGFISALIMEKNRTGSVAFNLISVHFFLIEGINLVWTRYQSRRQLKAGENQDEDRRSNKHNGDDDTVANTSILSGLWWIPTCQITADVFFVVGAWIDVVLSYYYFERSSDWSLPLARVFAFSTLLWLAASLMYLNVTLVMHYGWFDCCVGGDKFFLKRGVVIDPCQKEVADMDFVGPLPTYSVNSDASVRSVESY